ncbi:MAG TPA: hypothetical protein VFP65_23815 [Anaeromyxobacteraceae bacterium]|nr:hypothetical protein [Anaeromyxobacteraceae bacterium]
MTAIGYLALAIGWLAACLGGSWLIVVPCAAIAIGCAIRDA